MEYIYHMSEKIWPIRFKVLTILIFVFSVNTYGRDDWQSWNSFSIKYNISEKTGILWSPHIRIRDDISDLFIWNFRQGVFFNYNKNLTFGLNYLYKDQKNESGAWSDEHRLEVLTTVKWKFARFNFSDRNQYEYRTLGNDQKSRYRNSLRVSKPINLHGLDLTPFLKNEIYYDFDTSQLNQNRFFLGFTYKLNKQTRFELYYMLKSNRKGHDWDEANIVGTGVKVAF